MNRYALRGFVSEMEKLSSEEDVRRLLGEAVGEASMCWDPIPSHQVFDSKRASDIIDRLAVALREKRSQVYDCRTCGKRHAPRCDKCGSTRDLRSYHGPCGKCAFEKTSSFMKDVGTKIISSGKSLASAPGRTLAAAGDFIKSPREALKSGWHNTWVDPEKSGGRLGRGMFILGTGMAGATAIPKNDPTGRGESRSTRALRFGAGTVAGLAGMKHGILPSVALSMGADYAAGKLGRGIDKMRGYKPVPKPTKNPNLPTGAALAQNAVPGQG